MKEPEIRKILQMPEVTVEDVFQAEGADYSKRPPRPSLVEMHHQMIAEATQLVEPKLIWREVKIVATAEEEIQLEDGHKLTSRLLADVAGTADKLLLCAITMGDALDKKVMEYNKAGNNVQGFILDAAGTAFLSKAVISELPKLEKAYEDLGLKTSFNLGPGHSYWEKLEDIKVVFHYLEAEKIGIHLTNANLMSPRKSAAFVMGIGKDFSKFEGKTHCDFCDYQNKCYKPVIC